MVAQAPDRTLYTEDDLTLTCTIQLDEAVDTGVVVTAVWLGLTRNHNALYWWSYHSVRCNWLKHNLPEHSRYHFTGDVRLWCLHLHCYCQW